MYSMTWRLKRAKLDATEDDVVLRFDYSLKKERRYLDGEVDIVYYIDKKGWLRENRLIKTETSGVEITSTGYNHVTDNEFSLENRTIPIDPLYEVIGKSLVEGSVYFGIGLIGFAYLTDLETAFDALNPCNFVTFMVLSLVAFGLNHDIHLENRKKGWLAFKERDLAAKLKED